MSKTELKKDSVPTTYSKFNGHWTLSTIEIIEEKQSVAKFMEAAEPNKPQEWAAPVYLDDSGIIRPHSVSHYLSRSMKDVLITEDSIFQFNYPLEWGTEHPLSIHANKTFSLSPNEDTLRISYLDTFGVYLEETYLRTTFDDSVLNLLRTHKTNFPLLAGKWNLIREESDQYGQEYILDFPHKIPDQIHLTKEELQATFLNGRLLEITTDGQKKSYKLDFKNEELLLTPTDWFKEEEIPTLRFEQLAKEKPD